MVRITMILMLVVVMLAGCGSFWEDQGQASVASANARLRQAEAARQNAQAAIIDAEARGAMAASQADALRTSVDAVVDLADDGEYVVLFAGLAFVVLAFAGWAISSTHRQPAAAPPASAPAPRQWITIDAPDGLPVRMIREPQETPEQFAVRVAVMAAMLVESDPARLLSPPQR